MILLRLNILICAHELSPYQGSECSEGWNIVINLSKFHNLYVIYATGSQKSPFSYKDAIDDFIKFKPIPNQIKFYNVNQPKLTLLLSKLNYIISKKNTAIGNPILYFMGYKLWHKNAFKKAKEILITEKIDLVHLLNSITFREPGYLWKLNLPYVWGPTGGLSHLPPTYLKTLKFNERLLQKIRELYINYEFKKNRIKQAAKKADLIYTFSDHDQIKFIEIGAKKVLNLLDSGTTFLDLPIRNKENKIIILWAGQFVKRKAFNILLDSVVKLPNNIKTKFEFQILGNGILYDYYLKKIIDLNLSNLFIFKGEKNRDELFDIMKTCDLLVHTSYREATTNIIPEALSYNLPVVCHDISGMSIAINETCGHKIPLINENHSSNLLSSFLTKIAENDNLLKDLKLGAKKRSQEISWLNNAYNISEEYKKIIN